MQTHHGHHKPFRCKLCPFKSSYNSRLKTHILKAHAGKFSPLVLQCSNRNGLCILVAHQRCWFESRVLSPNLGKIFMANQDWPTYALTGIGESLDNVSGKTRILNKVEYFISCLFYFHCCKR